MLHSYPFFLKREVSGLETLIRITRTRMYLFRAEERAGRLPRSREMEPEGRDPRRLISAAGTRKSAG